MSWYTRKFLLPMKSDGISEFFCYLRKEMTN